MVSRHLSSEWLKPVPDHTRRAADDALQWLADHGDRPLILDSFCGTGMSTTVLANQHPDALVLGVDKSADRLSRHGMAECDSPDSIRRAGEKLSNYRLIRAECEPFWRCLLDAHIQLHSHYLLYPNPWPKGSQLKRRIHGHPAFPLLQQLGGNLELRTNWEIYAREFAAAVELLSCAGHLETFVPAEPMTLFERKYHERHQVLWRYRGQFS